MFNNRQEGGDSMIFNKILFYDNRLTSFYLYFYNYRFTGIYSILFYNYRVTAINTYISQDTQ